MSWLDHVPQWATVKSVVRLLRTENPGTENGSQDCCFAGASFEAVDMESRKHELNFTGVWQFRDQKDIATAKQYKAR